MIGVVATIKIQDGKADEFEQVGKDLMAKVKANEPGCMTYQMYKSRTEDNTYVMMEQYASEDDYKAHGKSEHFRAAGPAMGACLAGMPDIQVFDIVE